MSRDALIVTFIICFLSFTWAVYFLFSSPGGMPRKMRILGIVGLLAFIAQLWEILRTQSPSGVIAGEIFLLSSLALFWTSVFTIRKTRLGIAYGDLVPQAPITSGAYQLVRHPFYSAYLLFWIGGAISAERYWAYLIPFVMGAFYYDAAKSEERLILSSPAAPDYAEYMLRTGMFLPRLLPIRN